MMALLELQKKKYFLLKSKKLTNFIRELVCMTSRKINLDVFLGYLGKLAEKIETLAHR